MQSIMTVRIGSAEALFLADSEKTILDSLRIAGYTSPAAPCGGNGRCHKCTAVITGPLTSVGTGEAYFSDHEILLACRWKPAGSCRIELSDCAAMNILTSAQKLSGLDAGGLGLAVDIGTTTVAMSLYDLRTGKALASDGRRNVQRPFGADVISRISCCENGQEPELTTAIRTQIMDMSRELCQRVERNTEEICRIAIAGNTVMEHIFCGLDPSGIGRAPFIPQSLFGNTIPAAGILDGVSPECSIYLAPALAGYVGGDIMAGITANLSAMPSGSWLYLDIGTNGEMGLGNAHGFLCCAAAAGPAFEGAEIACGMPGAEGAIDRVTVRDGDLDFHVLGGKVARGICGSGLIDAAACLLALGAIDETGLLNIPGNASPALGKRLCEGEDGNMYFYFTPQVYLSQADIRQIQLAKAAIRAGVETLLDAKNMSAAQLDGILVAGGFGNYMDIRSAIRLGLLPDIPEEKIRSVGNAAGDGAALALHESGICSMEALTARCSYIELSSSRKFTMHYMEQLMFDTDE